MLYMKRIIKPLGIPLLIISTIGIVGFYSVQKPPSLNQTPAILNYEVDPRQQDLRLYWKDSSGNNYANFQQLKTNLSAHRQALLFAMNGGMYNQDLSPQGLYIEDGSMLAPLDTQSTGYGNFYLQPNGVFYLKENGQAGICVTKDFPDQHKVRYATQSGPMLLIDSTIHPAFTPGSSNLHIRNGVGLLPDGRLLFAMSKARINFFDFANFFLKRGCAQALYLDGFVSRTYLPAQDWQQFDGNFGVIIAEVDSLR